jgi:DNA/RNA endonuclease YhcR with UshA esterase domain
LKAPAEVRLLVSSSESDFRDEANFTVVLDTKALAADLKAAEVEDAAAHFRGKKVRVSGTVSLLNDRPQVMVKAPKQIQVIEK